MPAYTPGYATEASEDLIHLYEFILNGENTDLPLAEKHWK